MKKLIAAIALTLCTSAAFADYSMCLTTNTNNFYNQGYDWNAASTLAQGLCAEGYLFGNEEYVDLVTMYLTQGYRLEQARYLAEAELNN